MMIEYIQIYNFSCHKDTRIDLSETVTMIVGESLKGKTAIKRALEWVVLGKPTGGRICSHFADGEPTIVEIGVDGWVVKKTRKGSTTSWEVGGAEDEPMTFQGAETPDIVKNLFKMTESNLADQLEEHFLIAGSPSEIAKGITKDAKLDDAWAINKSLTSKINGIEKDIKNWSAYGKDIKEGLKAFRPLDDVGKEIEEIVKLQTELSEFLVEARSITRLTNEAKSNEVSEDARAELNNIKAKIEEVEEGKAEANGVRAELDSLNDVLSGDGVAWAQSSGVVDLGGLKKLSDEMSAISALMKETESEENSLSQLTSMAGDILDTLDLDAKLSEAKDDLIQIAADYIKAIEAESTCPYCLSPLSKSQIEILRASLEATDGQASDPTT